MSPSASRLSRAESQALTKRRLLDAARSIVEREGLAAVTVSRIAADAGVTTGAVYSNFKGGRAELMLEVTQDFARPLLDTPPVDHGPDAWLAGLAGLLGEHTDNAGAVSLATEAMSIALRDPKVRPAATAVARQSVDAVQQLLQSMTTADDASTARDRALVAVALFAGLSQYRALLGAEDVPLELCARAFTAIAGIGQDVEAQHASA